MGQEEKEVHLGGVGVERERNQEREGSECGKCGRLKGSGRRFCRSINVLMIIITDYLWGPIS